MDDETGGIFYRVHHFQFKLITGHTAAVANLTTGFGIKRCGFSDDFNFLPCGGCVEFLAIGHQQQYFGISAQRIVTHELSLDPLGRQIFIAFTDAVKGHHRSGPGTLNVHGLVEPIHIQVHFFIPDDILNDVHRESKGVIKLEDDISGHLILAPGPDIGQGIV